MLALVGMVGVLVHIAFESPRHAVAAACLCSAAFLLGYAAALHRMKIADSRKARVE
jgi:hypothetical protein